MSGRASLTRQHIDWYHIQVRSPYLAKDIDLLEKVQRRATMLLSSLCNLPYESRLEKLDLNYYSTIDCIIITTEPLHPASSYLLHIMLSNDVT